jgi:hypothetical protein
MTSRLFMAAAIVITTCVTAFGQTPGEPRDEQRPPTWGSDGGRIFQLFPPGDIYPVYVADPHRPTNAIKEGFYARARVPETSSPRTSLAAEAELAWCVSATGLQGAASGS